MRQIICESNFEVKGYRVLHLHFFHDNLFSETTSNISWVDALSFGGVCSSYLPSIQATLENAHLSDDLVHDTN